MGTLFHGSRLSSPIDRRWDGGVGLLEPERFGRSECRFCRTQLVPPNVWWRFSATSYQYLYDGDDAKGVTQRIVSSLTTSRSSGASEHASGRPDLAAATRARRRRSGHRSGTRSKPCRPGHPRSGRAMSALSMSRLPAAPPLRAFSLSLGRLRTFFSKRRTCRLR